MKLHTIDLQIMLYLLTYQKARNNDSNGVKKARKHRNIGDFKLSTNWWTRKSMCRPIGEIRCDDDFVVDQMVKKFRFVDHFACRPFCMSTKRLDTVQPLCTF